MDMDNSVEAGSVQVLEKFLEDEVKREKKLILKTWLVGCGLALFLTLYMWNLIAIPFDKIVLNPENLAAYVVGQVDHQIPKALANLEDQMVNLAPELAERSSGNIRTLLPRISEYGIQHVDSLVNTIQTLDRFTASATEEFFAEHSDDIRAYVKKYGRENFVEKFTDEMLESVFTQVESELGLNEALDVTSIQFLDRIGDELYTLSRKNSFNMAPSERLQRRLIASWASFISEAARTGPIVDSSRLEVMARMSPMENP
jgi:hypothetical protein